MKNCLFPLFFNLISCLLITVHSPVKACLSLECCHSVKDCVVYLVEAGVFVGFINLHIFPLQAAVADGGSAAARARSPPLVSRGPPLEASPWESCTFPGRHGYVQIGGRDGTWVGSHQRNNMCARHRAGSRALWSKPQKARNYRCLSFSITESLNTSGGTAEPSHRPLQLGGKLLLSNNLQFRLLPSCPKPPEITWLTFWQLQCDSEMQLWLFSDSWHVAMLSLHLPLVLVLFLETRPVVFKDRNVSFLMSVKCSLLILSQFSDDLLHN